MHHNKVLQLNSGMLTVIQVAQSHTNLAGPKPSKPNQLSRCNVFTLPLQLVTGHVVFCDMACD